MKTELLAVGKPILRSTLDNVEDITFDDDRF